MTTEKLTEEVRRQLRLRGGVSSDALNLIDVLTEKLAAVRVAAGIDVIGPNEVIDIGLTEEELQTTFYADDLREEYRSLQKAVRVIQKALL